MNLLGGFMLTFEEKTKIIEAHFPMLMKTPVSLGRFNYKYLDSAVKKQNIIYHMHPNGNGFVYTERIPNMKSEKNGYTNIRNYQEKELIALIQASIQSVQIIDETNEIYQELWKNQNGQTLLLVEENEQFHVYAGNQLNGIFCSYGKAAQYLDEEGFIFEAKVE